MEQFISIMPQSGQADSLREGRTKERAREETNARKQRGQC